MKKALIVVDYQKDFVNGSLGSPKGETHAVLAKAALPESLIVVDAACTASNDDTMNEKALDVMDGLQIKIVNRPV